MKFQQLFWYWRYNIVSKQEHEDIMKTFIELGKSNWECYAVTRDKVYFKKKSTGVIYNLIALSLGGLLIYNIVRTLQQEE